MAPSSADTSWRSRQLALDLAPEPAFDRENFFVSESNLRAYEMVELWPAWPDSVLVLIGPAGAGKSHLGAIWAARAKAQVLAAPALAEVELAALTTRPLLIEHLEAIGSAQAELFHLVNLMREQGTSLLLTSREPLDAWGITIADLASRLRLAPRVEIKPPDDALMRAVLVKLLIERQLVVDTGLIDYAAVRLERSLDAARSFVDALDRCALSRKSRVTRALAAEVLRAEQLCHDDAGALE
jgi:chromosomal replication initiation ATPase DnaA